MVVLAWLARGASFAEARALARFRPISGGELGFQDQTGGSPALDLVDMSGVSIDGQPFDQVLATANDLSTFGPDPALSDYLQGGGGFQIDSQGNIYDAQGTLLMDNGALMSADPVLAQELASLPNPATSPQWALDPATGNLVDASTGQVLASADQLSAQGVSLSDMLRSTASVDGAGNVVDGNGNILATADQLAASGQTAQQIADGINAQNTGLNAAPPGAPTGAPNAGITAALTKALTGMGLPASLAASLGAALPLLGIGGAGLFAGNAIANRAPTSYTPTLAGLTPGQSVANAAVAPGTPGATSLAGALTGALGGQQSLVDYLNTLTKAQGARAAQQAPAITGIQGNALASLASGAPGTGQTPAVNAPVTSGLEQLLLTAMQGSTNPELAREFARQLDTLRSLGAIRGGPGGDASYFSSSPGIEAATSLSESQNIQRYNDYLNTIGRLAPLYGSALTTGQNLGTSQLQNLEGLTGLGTQPISSLAGAYGNIAPIPNIAGWGSNPNLFNANVQNQASLASLGAQQARAASLGGQVQGLITAAGNAALKA